MAGKVKFTVEVDDLSSLALEVRSAYPWQGMLDLLTRSMVSAHSLVKCKVHLNGREG